jgi:hypothetical protein
MNSGEPVSTAMHDLYAAVEETEFDAAITAVQKMAEAGDAERPSVSAGTIT